MTILEITASTRIGGVETYLLRLSKALMAKGHRVIFVTRSGTPLEKELRAAGIEVHTFFRGSSPLTQWRLKRLIRREKVDVVHTHIFSANRQGARAGRACGVPVVARVPATEGAQHYAEVELVTAVSEAVKNHLVEQGMSPAKIEVLYNGVDLARFSDLPSRELSRQQFNLPPDAFAVTCVASLTPRKGQRFLLDAVKQLENPNVHILLAGEGDQETPLREQAKALGLEDRVHFLGFTGDVRPVLAASDVVVLPSSHEGLPNSLLEAMAAGLPVIATNIAGVPEIVSDGKTGFLVPHSEVEPLTQALKTYISDEELRQNLAKAGRQWVHEKFDDRQHLLRAVELLESVASGKR